MGYQRRPWDCGDEHAGQRRQSHQNPWQGWIGPEWGSHGRGRGPGGPPPWIQGLLGMGTPPQPPGPRVRRGDVRTAILDVVREAGETGEPINGYQVIQQIADRSGGAWRPSPGSVYPTVQQLHDEGLIESDDDHGRKTIRLTAAGHDYVQRNRDLLDAVWAPFEQQRQRESGQGADLRGEIGQVMSAVWQIVSQGSEAQRRALVEVLVDTRRTLYGILADGADPRADVDATDDETDDDTEIQERS